MPSVKFGGPFKGYVSSVKKHLVTPDKIGPDSTNVYLNPFDGSLIRRSGSTIVGDTVNGSNVEQTGLLEQKFGGKCRRLGELDSPSFADGMPVPSALVTCESNSASFPTVDTGYFGTLFARDIAGGNNYSWLSEFSSTHYPSAGGAGTLDLKVVPLWYESGEGGYTRGAFQFARRFLAPGSRSWLDAGNWRYLPNLRGTPARWNLRLNVSAGAGSESVRIFPTGPFGPLYPPTIGNGTASTGSDAAWNDGDTFYYSVMFQFEDGSYSAPFMPRPVNANLSGGLGFKTVGTAGGTSKYRSIPWTNIPIGPDGTIARVLLRSPKQTLATTSDVLTISPGNLQICGILRNNIQTSYTDTLGDDTGLLDAPDIVRFDWTCPRRARSIGSGDQRAIIGYTLPSPCAIMIAPTGSSVSRDLNLADTGAIVGASNFLVRVTSTQVELLKIATSGTPNFAGGGNAVAFTYASYGTLQDLVDAINATTVSSLCGEWAAALAPGVDGTLASTSICQTITTLTGCSASGTALTTASSTAVPLGAKVYDSNGKIPAGTYISARTSATALTLSAAATGAVAASLDFYCDTGDNNLAAGYNGYIRAFAPSVPAMLYLKRSTQVGYDKPDKRSVYFTVSSPGAAQTGVSLAANAYASPNRRQPIAKSGNLMAITDLENAAMCEYSRSRSLFVNQRGVTSGEDFDYRLVLVNPRRGCIDSRSAVAVNNVAFCLTPHGIVGADRSLKEVVITNDIHNPTTGVGSLLSEINKCLNGAQADSDVGIFPIAHMGQQLHIGYRVSNVSSPTKRQVYDFSPGSSASGIESLIQTEQGNPIGIESPYAIYQGKAYGWSAPFTAGYSAMTEIARDSGPVRYGWSENNAGSTGDGRLDVIDDSTASGLDNGVAYIARAYTPQLRPPAFTAIVAKRGEFILASTSGSDTATVYRKRDRSSAAVLTMPSTTGDYGRVIQDYPIAIRSNGECYEVGYVFTNDGDVWWEHTLDYDTARIYA